ncbi:auxin-responsive GH3 family protein, partial [Striga asiatica]
MSNGFYRKAENGPDGGLDGRFLDRDRCQWGEAQLARRSPQNEDRGHMLWAARFIRHEKKWPGRRPRRPIFGSRPVLMGQSPIGATFSSERGSRAYAVGCT